MHDNMLLPKYLKEQVKNYAVHILKWEKLVIVKKW